MFRRIKKLNGFEVRPNKGKCPRCGVPKDQFCKKECPMIDNYNPHDINK